MMKNKKKELTILPSSYDMLQDAIGDYCQNIEMPLTNSGSNILIITDDNINIVVKLHQKLKEALVCGQGDAAYYLAQFHYNGWLVEKSSIKGDFILEIGKKLDSIKCTNTSYKSESFLSKECKKLATACANSISNTKIIYLMGINDVMKSNAEFAFNKHLENTTLKDILYIPESAFSPTSTVSAPLPNININKYPTENQDTYSEIKRSVSHAPSNSIIIDEQTPILGQDKYPHDDSGCTCLMM
ncbi:MAG TPA: hypothetical protein LFW21_03565 [Rickettsia endosymbiont of Pyrocoelia pectoralis]|nr:hypothetical protein [Rickettsia endosymbiont of Pyrocoelia pectoralis]